MSHKKTINVALIGNPNTGKTSLFNELTGLNQKVGNYPGVTVDKKDCHRSGKKPGNNPRHLCSVYIPFYKVDFPDKTKEYAEAYRRRK